MARLQKIPGLLPASVVGALLALLAVAIFVDDGAVLIAPLIGFSWLLTIGYKGYLRYGLPVFLVTLAVYVVSPEPWTAIILLGSMVLLACLPARRMIEGKWKLAAKDHRILNWFLPASAEEDIGAITGDASIHLMVVIGGAMIIGLVINGYL
jgi:hypothetical protein